jgi:hypothetical protein
MRIYVNNKNIDPQDIYCEQALYCDVTIFSTHQCVAGKTTSKIKTLSRGE